MDPSRSSYPHHATRYAAFPPPLQPPAPPYSDFYRPHRTTLHPPPPPPQFRPPPPPQPQSQPQHHHQPYLRPPPPLNSQNPQFTYNPNNVTLSPKPPIREDYNHPRDLPTRRIPELVQHHNHHYVRESRPVFRVLSDDSPFPDSNLDQREAYHRQIEKFEVRNEYEGVELRKRDEVNDYHRSRSQFGPSRDFRVPATQVGSVSRSLDMNSGGYEARRELAYDGGESVRDMRELLIERGSNQVVDDGDGIVRVFGVKRELYRSREGNVEFEKHSSKGSREGSHEYNRTPRKQMQKKSALLRIQKPSYRNREDDRMHHSVYYDDGKSSSFRGSKDQNVHMDRGIRENVREGSPVQLDVSFKSNSLVAKAIVTPTSSNTAISDTKLEARSSKVRKVLVLDKECTSKSHARTSEDNVKLDKSVSVRNAPPSSYKDSKDSKERASASGKGSASVTCSSSGSGGKNGLPVNGRVKSVIEKGGRNVASDKTSFPKIAKKKKVVKKVVKKVLNPNLSSSTSQPVEKYDTNVKADRFPCGNPTASQADKATAFAMDIVSNTNLSSSTSQPIEESDTNVKANGFPCGKPTSSKADKATAVATDIVSNPNLSSSTSQPLGKSDTNVEADGFSSGNPTASEADKATAVAMDIVDSQSCPDAIIEGFKDNNVEPFSEAMKSVKVGSEVESYMLCVHNHKRKRSVSTSPQVSPRHEKSKFDGKMTNENPPKNLDITSNAENLTISPNEICSSDICSAEDVRRDYVQDGDFSLPGNDAVRGSSEVLLSAEGNTDFPSLSSERIEIQEDNVNACNTTAGLGNLLSISQKDITVSGIGSVVIGVTDPCMNEGTQSVTNAGFPEISSETLHPSKSGETFKENFITGADSSNHKKDTVLACDSHCNNAEELKSPAQGTDDVMGEHFSSERVVALSENASMGECSSDVFSLSSSAKDSTNILTNNENVEMHQFDLSGSEVDTTHSERLTRNNPTNWVDTTLRLSFRKNSPTDFIGTSNGCDDVGLKSFTVGTDVNCCTAPVSSSAKVTSNGSSPSPRNSTKFSDSELGQFNLISCDINERLHGTCTNTSVVNSPVQPEEEATVSGADTRGNSDLLRFQREVTTVIGDCSDGGHLNPVVFVRDGFEADASIREHFSTVEHSISLKENSSCSTEIGDEHVVNGIPVISEVCHQNDPMDIESNEGERMGTDDAEKQFIVEDRIDLYQNISKLPSPNLDEKLIGEDVEDDQNDVDSSLCRNASYFSSLGVDNRAFVADASDELTNSTSANDEFVEVISDSLPDIRVSETLSHSMDAAVSLNVSHEEKILAEKPSMQGGSDLSVSSGTQSAEISMRSGHPVQDGQSLTWNKGLLPSQYSKSILTPNATNRELYGSKSLPSQSVSRIYPGRSPFVFNSSKSNASSTHITKPRTWHRTDGFVASARPGTKAILSNVPAPRQLPKKVTPFQKTSYIRKGNSLVRKPTPVSAQSPVSVYRLNSSDKDEVLKTTRMNSRIDASRPSNFVTMVGKGSFERPRTPPLPNLPKITNHASNSLDDHMCSAPAEAIHNNSIEIMTDLKLTESSDVSKSSEDVLNLSESPVIQNGQVNTSESQNELNDGNIGSSNVKSITYVKRKSNQLVATSNSGASYVQNTLSATPFSTDGYYKRRKNQLIRASLESQVKSADSVPNENTNSKDHDMISGRSKRRLTKVVTKTRKPSKFSLVWTLHGAQISKNNGDLLRGQKALSHFFPWKRAGHWRSFVGNSPSSFTISKLLLLRKRDTIYTRSKHGFSLVKSKVLSVDGSSLKWSKSIERHSKKANEEATLAVAAADRKKRERTGAARIISRTKNRNNSPRERIFRIGSVRYKMDSSGRTLQRISDDETPCSVDAKTKNDAKKSYIPKRLIIGKNEYVRIGSGNQLIRDPKKRTRILASEKIRWSLHTARSRLARKRKYCQFFTRFGKCNKDDGKCPYVHDPSKIAVCTKFLNGLCSNSDCKLTHKVIPERMPDCSYFLQGLCTNASCPYRHVHVNPNAPTCEGFLRGYCAEGNECRKKHSYVCPVYEATGSCSEGSKCKLHHPRNRSKVKKGKQLRDNRSIRGRYFGSLSVKASDLGTAVSERHSALDDGSLFGSSIGDYLKLDFSDEDARENTHNANVQAPFSASDSMEMELGNLDELIRPVRIMNIRQLGSPEFGGSIERNSTVEDGPHEVDL